RLEATRPATVLVGASSTPVGREVERGRSARQKSCGRIFTMSHEHTELAPGAPRGRGWPRRLWIIAAGALIVLLAGGLCVYCLTHTPRPWPESDRETFGTEEDAKTFAFTSLKYQLSNWELARRDFEKEALATFDPETGYWTVTWTHAN